MTFVSGTEFYIYLLTYLCVQVDNTMFNISYEATLVAGQIGFSLHEESTPVVEPFAGWAMLTTQDTHTAVRNHIQVRGQCSLV